MQIEYVLIETFKKETTAKTRKIVSLLKKTFSNVTSNKIIINGKRKNFELSYKITCCATTGTGSTDNIYNLIIKADYDDKRKSAELLEKAHKDIVCQIELEQKYHFIIANDELSEYYCNRIYPQYQKLERQLRHLIFKVVTKAYGHLWTQETIAKELKKKLKDDIKGRNGITKDDILIEQALHEMTLGELINYLFYGPTQQENFSEYIDEYYPLHKLDMLEKDQLIGLIEQTRQKSVWNLFLAKEFNIEAPKSKLNFLRNKRNNVAHCKQFYSNDYKQVKEYINLFLPQIENAIERANIIEDTLSTNIVYGFSSFVIGLVLLTQAMDKIVPPATKALAQLGSCVVDVLQDIVNEKTSRIVETLEQRIAQKLVAATSAFPTTASSLETLYKHQKLVSDAATKFSPAFSIASKIPVSNIKIDVGGKEVEETDK